MTENDKLRLVHLRLERLLEIETENHALIEALVEHRRRLNSIGETTHLVVDGSRDSTSYGPCLTVPTHLVVAMAILEIAERGAYEACHIGGEPIWPILT